MTAARWMSDGEMAGKMDLVTENLQHNHEHEQYAATHWFCGPVLFVASAIQESCINTIHVDFALIDRVIYSYIVFCIVLIIKSIAVYKSMALWPIMFCNYWALNGCEYPRDNWMNFVRICATAGNKNALFRAVVLSIFNFKIPHCKTITEYPPRYFGYFC